MLGYAQTPNPRRGGLLKQRELQACSSRAAECMALRPPSRLRHTHCATPRRQCYELKTAGPGREVDPAMGSLLTELAEAVYDQGDGLKASHLASRLELPRELQSPSRSALARRLIGDTPPPPCPLCADCPTIANRSARRIGACASPQLPFTALSSPQLPHVGLLLGGHQLHRTVSDTDSIMVILLLASLRTDNSPQRKEARPLSHALTSD